MPSEIINPNVDYVCSTDIHSPVAGEWIPTVLIN